MKILILAGTQPDFSLTEFESHLELGIKRYLQFGSEIIVVLGGDWSEHILRHSRSVTDCDLVFDTHTEPTTWTNLSAGLHAVQSWCLTVSALEKWPDHSLLRQLHNCYGQLGAATPHHLIRPKETYFPALVSRTGIGLIRNDQSIQGPNDPRLKVYEVSGAAPTGLATPTTSF